MNFYKTGQFNGVVKDVDTKSGIVVGYFAAFGNIDSDGDIFEKGAFAKSIRERGPESSQPRIMHLLQHDVRSPLGKPKKLEEDAFGLRFETKISDTTFGKDTLQLYADGVYNEHSVGFMSVDEQFDTEEDVNRIREAKLMEGSTVTWGANEQTPFQGFKSLDRKGLVEKMDAINKQLRKGNLTDHTFELLEIWSEQIKSLLMEEPQSTPTEEPVKLDDFYDILTKKLQKL